MGIKKASERLVGQVENFDGYRDNHSVPTLSNF